MTELSFILQRPKNGESRIIIQKTKKKKKNIHRKVDKNEAYFR